MRGAAYKTLLAWKLDKYLARTADALKKDPPCDVRKMLPPRWLDVLSRRARRCLESWSSSSKRWTRTKTPTRSARSTRAFFRSSRPIAKRAMAVALG